MTAAPYTRRRGSYCNGSSLLCSASPPLWLNGPGPAPSAVLRAVPPTTKKWSHERSSWPGQRNGLDTRGDMHQRRELAVSHAKYVHCTDLNLHTASSPLQSQVRAHSTPNAAKRWWHVRSHLTRWSFASTTWGLANMFIFCALDTESEVR